MKVFVTGGTGFLGNHLVKCLVRNGYEVKTLVRSEKKAEKLLGSTDATFVKGDMNDVDAFAEELKGCEVLFHTAAYFRETFSFGKHWPELERINITNTLRLFELAKEYGVKLIIHTSSSNTIKKRLDNTPSNEEDIRDSEDAMTLYAKSKIISDRKIAEFSARHSLPVITFLPGWMMGPVDAAPTSGGKYILDYLQKRLPGNINVSIDIVDVRDVAEAMVAAITKVNKSERFLVAGRHVHLKDLSKELEIVTGIPSPKRNIPVPIAFTLGWIVDRVSVITKKEMAISVNGIYEICECKRYSSDKAKKEIGITFRPLHDTLQDATDWFTENSNALLTQPD
ncbi:NAD-dependent epimerase/dehydratase family protein [Gracilibacillus thailandensis]|uniref:NAD-dependent epimerase/dehydratase family protein n=1 Tax=Gracilibacillus thailandensis TaxID=563735 RepID=A0A6N7R4B3_9BACI|nr:NAD-dependent epimerase/dehydratase family protein [Gracilibacillus thailandensis]MRI68059.1 NAD-dependent epimerase/dehydratase family protein [Gracilibacillus thailandensis]